MSLLYYLKPHYGDSHDPGVISNKILRKAKIVENLPNKTILKTPNLRIHIENAYLEDVEISDEILLILFMMIEE